MPHLYHKVTGKRITAEKNQVPGLLESGNYVLSQDQVEGDKEVQLRREAEAEKARKDAEAAKLAEEAALKKAFDDGHKAGFEKGYAKALADVKAKEGAAEKAAKEAKEAKKEPDGAGEKKQ